MNRGIPETESDALFYGLTIIPLISFIFSLPITFFIFIYLGFPSLTKLLIIYLPVAQICVRGAIIENQMLAKKGGPWHDPYGEDEETRPIVGQTMMRSILVWTIGIAISQYFFK